MKRCVLLGGLILLAGLCHACAGDFDPATLTSPAVSPQAVPLNPWAADFDQPAPLSLDVTPKTAATTASSLPFAASSSSFQSYGNFGADVTNRHVRLGGATVGLGHYFFDGVSLNLEGSGYYLDESGAHGAAGSVYGLLRQHLVRRQNYSLFADVGFGIIRADHELPANGTEFNFVFHSGPGLTWRLDDDLHLLAGGRFFHVSNAKMQGDSRNPSVNGIEGYVGIMKTFF